MKDEKEEMLRKAEKAEMLRKAASRLSSGLGSYARGWCDGYAGQDPRPTSNEADVNRYETGWLEGVLEREALLKS